LDELFTNVVDINDCWVSFTTVFEHASLYLLNLSTSIFREGKKKIFPLFIRQLYHKKNAVNRLIKQYKTDTLKAKFKLAETICKEAYTTYVTSKENGLIKGGNLGSFYRYVNSKLVHKTGIGVLTENGSHIYDDQTKARY